jgi:uncharacterized protein involved in exopolysaccharide biosynthesis
MKFDREARVLSAGSRMRDSQLTLEPPRPASSGRRLKLFGTCFLVGCAISLSYTFLRPAIYQSRASLLLSPRSPRGDREESTQVSAVALQRHVIMHPSFIAEVQARLRSAGHSAGSLALAEIQEALHAEEVSQTNVLQLRAEGTRRDELAPLLEAWIGVYLEHHATSDQEATRNTSVAIRRQLEELEQRVQKKRAELSAYRREHDIASMKRDENRVLARVKSLLDSLHKAEASAVAAEARLQAIEQAFERGEPVADEASQQELLAMQQRAAAIRELLAGLGRVYTDAFLADDDQVVALNEQLQLIEAAINDQQANLGSATLAQAELDVSLARETTRLFQQQYDEAKETAAEFTTRFAEHEALAQDLTQLERLYRELQERVVQTEVMREALPPEVEVLQQPSQPVHPIRPPYARDAMFSVAGSCVAGLIAVMADWLATRPARAPVAAPGRTVFYPWPAFGPAGTDPPPAQLPAPDVASPNRWLPPELSRSELTELLRAADATTRPLIGSLLCGLSCREATGLHWPDVDYDAGRIRVRGRDARQIELAAPVIRDLARLGQRTRDPFGPVWSNERSQPLRDEALHGMITAAAHLAGLERAAEIDGHALRHSHIAFLVRQGVPLDEVATVSGSIATELEPVYRQMTPPDASTLSSVQRQHAALSALADQAPRDT